MFDAFLNDASHTATFIKHPLNRYDVHLSFVVNQVFIAD